MKNLKIAFIGAGNMATSIIRGLLDQGMPVENIRASDPSSQSLAQLHSVAGVATSNDNTAVVDDADVVILAVKPQVMAQVLENIQPQLSAREVLVISIAAGITIATLEKGLGASTAVVRCMPNTPALLGCGATALYANANTTAQQAADAGAILAAVGTVCWVSEEPQLDAVTALSGSGPAYFFLFIEAMVDAGVQLGLDAETSRNLALQTGLGATRMAAQGEVDLQELRRRVTSPGGTTERAIQSFEDSGLRGTIERAMQAALDRAREMAQEHT